MLPPLPRPAKRLKKDDQDIEKDVQQPASEEEEEKQSREEKSERSPSAHGEKKKHKKRKESKKEKKSKPVEASPARGEEKSPSPGGLAPKSLPRRPIPRDPEAAGRGSESEEPEHYSEEEERSFERPGAACPATRVDQGRSRSWAEAKEAPKV